MSDTELLDALEWFIENNGGLLLHNHGYQATYPGLGLRCTGRSLRQALEQSMKLEATNAK
jgi:hypothetical protein